MYFVDFLFLILSDEPIKDVKQFENSFCTFSPPPPSPPPEYCQVAVTVTYFRVTILIHVQRSIRVNLVKKKRKNEQNQHRTKLIHARRITNKSLVIIGVGME